VFNLEMLGPDHPGIVQEITQCLAQLSASVEEMETGLQRAPMGGDMLFQAQARVHAPTGLKADDLRNALEYLAGSLMVEKNLSDGNI